MHSTAVLFFLVCSMLATRKCKDITGRRFTMYSTPAPPRPFPHLVSAIVASFGGLLMLLQGEQKHLLKLQLDQKIYCLLRKTAK